MSNIIVYTLLHKEPNIYDYRDCQGTLLYISMFLLLIWTFFHKLGCICRRDTEYIFL